VVFAGTRLDGLLTGRIRRDGANATARLAALVQESRFHEHAQLLMLQGIALGGFNVVDIAALSREVARPVLVVARRPPDLDAIREALRERVPGGRRKWAILQRTGPMEAVAGLHVQRAGLSLEEARDAIASLTLHGRLPEPIRVAHLIAGGLATGHSRGRA